MFLIKALTYETYYSLNYKIVSNKIEEKVPKNNSQKSFPTVSKFPWCPFFTQTLFNDFTIQIIIKLMVEPAILTLLTVICQIQKLS